MTRTKLNLILASIAWMLAIACALTYKYKWLPEHQPAPVQEPPIVVAVIPVAEEDDPLYHLTAIEFYPVPMDHDLQAFIIHTCEEVSIDPAMIMAMIDRESSFKADAVGDSGDSIGLMQIQERWHSERMERLGVFDLFNPYQNVTVGIDFMAELLDRYTLEEALTVYNSGSPGQSDYSKYVLEQMEVYSGV